MILLVQNNEFTQEQFLELIKRTPHNIAHTIEEIICLNSEYQKNPKTIKLFYQKKLFTAKIYSTKSKTLTHIKEKLIGKETLAYSFYMRKELAQVLGKSREYKIFSAFPSERYFKKISDPQLMLKIITNIDGIKNNNFRSVHRIIEDKYLLSIEHNILPLAEQIFVLIKNNRDSKFIRLISRDKEMSRVLITELNKRLRVYDEEKNEIKLNKDTSISKIELKSRVTIIYDIDNLGEMEKFSLLEEIKLKTSVDKKVIFFTKEIEISAIKAKYFQPEIIIPDVNTLKKEMNISQIVYLYIINRLKKKNKNAMLYDYLEDVDNDKFSEVFSDINSFSIMRIALDKILYKWLHYDKFNFGDEIFLYEFIANYRSSSDEEYDIVTDGSVNEGDDDQHKVKPRLRIHYVEEDNMYEIIQNDETITVKKFTGLLIIIQLIKYFIHPITADPITLRNLVLKAKKEVGDISEKVSDENQIDVETFNKTEKKSEKRKKVHTSTDPEYVLNKFLIYNRDYFLNKISPKLDWLRDDGFIVMKKYECYYYSKGRLDIEID